jgi:isoleucyl-tRNA synthetase
MERVAAVVEKEGAGAWYRQPLSDFRPEGNKCPKCGKDQLRKETDILDVWFDSACSFAAVAAKRPNLRVPVDLYLEGSDQHRGWSHSTLLVGVGAHEKSPYKTCLTHGFVVDGEGKKMSKSVGNTVAPEKLIAQYGAEVVRLWVASSDYRDDVRLSEQILKGLAEGYRKIRNTIRYALSNLYDFDPANHAVKPEALLPLDQWAQSRLDDLVQKVRLAYESYEFHLVYHSVVDFCAMDLSAVYFDILKDRLYTAKTDGPARRSAQTVLHRVAGDLLRLLAPVMSFTAEEAWGFLPGRAADSVFLAGMPEASKAKPGPAVMERYERLFALRAAVLPLLEAARRDKVIGASLEAKVMLSATGAARAFLDKVKDELPAILIVSEVQLAEAPAGKAVALSLPASFGEGAVHAEIGTASGQKCPRCWTYSPAVGTVREVCDKCAAALGL